MSNEPTYFPYLRAKQSELAAIENELPALTQHGRVTPVLEPVLENTNALSAFLGQCQNDGLDVVVIENPTVGELIGQTSVIRSLIAANQAIPGFILEANTTRGNVSQFSRAHSGDPVVLIHRSANLTSATVNGVVAAHGADVSHIFECDAPKYVRAIQGQGRAKLRDVFQSQTKNAAYPSRSDFGDLPFTHGAEGFNGFGDYLTIGRKYVPGGGPAWAVAIHVTRDTGAQTLECRHFVSSSNFSQADPNGKQLEAIDDLFAAIQRQPHLFIASRGIDELRTIHQSRHATNLAGLKRISIRHHLELMMATI